MKVGRELFAEHVRRELEAEYPDVRFDWDALVATPIPPPDADHWRERRRAARAAKQAAAAESAAVEEVEAVEGGREPFAVSAPEASEGAPRAPEPQRAPVPLPRRRRRRGRRRGAQPPGNQPPGNEAAPPADKPDGGQSG